MNSVICTLFEGNYHFGLAALINSLYKHGYRGTILAGYRGTIPPWSIRAKKNPALGWPGASSLNVAHDLVLHFLPVETEFHLTNYKPYFMLRLFEHVAKSAESITYFDPDIVVKCNWNYFEKWVSYGVALVHEIRANDMPPTHPLRREWEGVIKLAGRKKTRELNSYINGGFCGVSKENVEFLDTWVSIFQTGVEHFSLTPAQWIHSYDRTYLFYAQDQDALNVAAMCSESPISEMGPEGMDFVSGGTTMSHSVGFGKPWRKNFMLSVFKGFPPGLPDKLFWANVNFPIKCFSTTKIKFKMASISAASFIGRFYRRN